MEPGVTEGGQNLPNTVLTVRIGRYQGHLIRGFVRSSIELHIDIRDSTMIHRVVFSHSRTAAPQVEVDGTQAVLPKGARQPESGQSQQKPHGRKPAATQVTALTTPCARIRLHCELAWCESPSK